VAGTAAVRTALAARVAFLIGPSVLFLAHAFDEDAEREVVRGVSPGLLRERREIVPDGEEVRVRVGRGTPYRFRDLGKKVVEPLLGVGQGLATQQAAGVTLVGLLVAGRGPGLEVHALIATRRAVRPGVH
jgi:hypothetical protein